MTKKTNELRTPIAIVGIGGLFPGAVDIRAFWRNVVRGVDLMTDVPATHWRLEDYFDADPKAPDKTYCRRGAFLPEVPFDTLANGIPPSMLSSTDTSQLLGLLVARTTLQDALDGKLETTDRSRISVLLGVTSGQELFGQMAARLSKPAWEAGMRAAGLDEDDVKAASAKISAQFAPWTEATFPGLLGNVVAGRIANRLDTGGTNAVTDAACASSFAAISMGVDELVLGRADIVLTGGVDTLNDIFMYMCFSKTPALSASGICRPFDKQADGTLLGEGLGMVALKRLDDAERDGNKIYAVIRGIGTSSDGRSKSVYAPVAAGQASALRRAYEAAGYSPSTVELVEAHGTGTRAGDAAEIEGLRIAFEESGRKDRQWCAVGSVKSQIGHTKSAAGAAGLLKAALSLHHKVLPPTLHVTEPNPAIDFAASPFFLPTEARPWVRASDHPRRASVSSFGFGGSNFHIALEEYVGEGRKAERLDLAQGAVFVASGETAGALTASLSAIVAQLDAGASMNAAAGRAVEAFVPAHTRRIAFVAATADDARALAAKAADAVTRGSAMPPGVFAGEGAFAGKVAFVFPGQGSQSVGMGAGLAIAFDEARSALDEADDAKLGDTALSRVIFPPTAFDADTRAAHAAKITATEWAQPALGATSVAALRVLASFGVVPAMVAGHSFGEIVALHAAGALDFSSMLRVARKRGELMAAASAKGGAMVAVAASLEVVTAAISDAAPSATVVVANHNAPDQVVLSGETSDLDAVVAKLVAAKVGTRKLAVSTAFHSSLVADAAAPFAEFLSAVAITAPRIPVYANATATEHATSPAALREAIANQIAQPVRFVDEIRAMHAAGARVFVEVGPGTVLTSLIGRILGQDAIAIATDAPRRDGAPTILATFARLVAEGVLVDLTRLPQEAATKPISKSATEVGLRGVNHGRPETPAPAPRKMTSVIEPPRPLSPQEVPAMTTRKPEQPNAIQPTRLASPAPQASPSPRASHSQPEPTGWLEVFREAQRQTAAAHEAFQKSMTDAHVAYLQSSENSANALASLLTGTPVAPNVNVRMPVNVPAPLSALAPIPTAPPAPAPAPQAAPSAPLPVNVPVPVHVPAPIPRAKRQDPSALLLTIVAEKTGYPIDSLTPEMSLEADLGIDSIKRVEILGAFKEHLPEAAELDPLALAQLATLGEISRALSPVTERSPIPPAPSLASPASPDAAAVFLAIVSEKTGYPPDSLSLDMSLEADLGIDSIKRVEILGAFKERVAAAPDVDPLKLAQLATLGEISRALAPPVAAPPARVDMPTPTTKPTATRAITTSAHRGIVRTQEIAPRSCRPFQPPAGRPILVVDDGRGIATAIAALLEDRGMHAEVLARGDSPDHAKKIGGLVDVSALGEIASFDDAVVRIKESLVLARGVSADLRDAEGSFFFAAFDTGGDFGASLDDSARGVTGGLAGLVKTAALEWPSVACKALDVDLTGMAAIDAARVIVDELASGFDAVEVGRRGQLRVEPVVVAEAAPAGAPVLGVHSVLVASGGARGVTATTLRAIAAVAHPAIVLLGRTSLDEKEPDVCDGVATEAKLKQALIAFSKAEGRALSLIEIGAWAQRILAAREIRAFLRELEEGGARAIYVAADVRDPASVRRAVDVGRAAFGPITGIVHGAGVLADKRIEDKTREQVDKVIDTKVKGLRALLDATASDPVSLLCAFSSVAGRYGNVGQVDYAMANEAMTKMLHAEQRRRGPATLVKALHWGPWEGGMVTPALHAIFAERGVHVLSHAEGAKFFVDELTRASAGVVEVVFGGALMAKPVTKGDDAIVVRQRIDARSHAFLADHAVHGVPVLPVVFALELIAEAACALDEGLVIGALRDVRVLRGVRLANFSNGGNELDVVLARNPANRAIHAEIRTRDAATPSYSASVEMAHAKSHTTRAPAVPPLEPYPMPRGGLYQDHLFHGPRFQLIDSIEGVSDRAMVARIRGLAGARWTARRWRLDAAAFDAGLQLVLLWARHITRGAFLPTSIGAVLTHTQGPLEGDLRCVLLGESVTQTKAKADVFFVDANGRVLAELRGVEAHRLPEDTAFTNGHGGHVIPSSP